MIPSPIVRLSKKGGKVPAGQAPHRPRQWSGQDPLVHRAKFVLAPPISQTENSGREVPFHARGTYATGLLGHLLSIPQLLILFQALNYDERRTSRLATVRFSRRP